MSFASAEDFDEKDDFRSFLLISAILHASFALVFTVKKFLISDEEIFLPPAIRVDMVALPDKLPDTPMTSAPPAEKTPAPKPVEAKPKAEPAKPKPMPIVDPAKKAKDDQKRALEKLKAMSALDKIKGEVREEEARAQSEKARAEAEQASRQQFKGNVISSGDSFTGIARLQVNEYLSAVKVRVRDNWVLPQWLSDSSLKALIIIAIDSRGQIVRREIGTSSGNEVFDASCLAAVEQAAPFAAPPSNIEEVPIAIRFPFE